MRRFSLFVLAALFVLALAVAAMAADTLPWDDLEITIGGVVLVWGAVVAAVIQVGKHVYFGERAVLDTSGKIWAANLVLGGVGVFIYQVTSGATIVTALINAGAAVLTASGIFEGAKTALGKQDESNRATVE